MIKNVIFDVGKVLVEWDCDSALRRLGFDERARQAVVQATVRSPYWNELDRSAVSDGELLAHFLDGAKGYEREVRLFWDNIGLAIQTYPYSRSWIQGLKKAGYGVYILSNYGRRTYGPGRSCHLPGRRTGHCFRLRFIRSSRSRKSTRLCSRAMD